MRETAPDSPRARFRALYLAPTRVACEAARDELAVWLHEQAQAVKVAGARGHR